MIICAVSLVNSAILSNVNLLQIFSEKFRAPKPLPIYYDSSIESKVKLMKDTSLEFDLSLKVFFFQKQCFQKNKTCTDLHRPAQTCTDLHRLAQTCTDLLGLLKDLHSDFL